MVVKKKEAMVTYFFIIQEIKGKEKKREIQSRKIN